MSPIFVLPVLACFIIIIHRMRPMGIHWLKSIVEQCDAARVACFVKQDSGPKAGKQGDIPDELWMRKEFPV